MKLAREDARKNNRATLKDRLVSKMRAFNARRLDQNTVFKSYDNTQDLRPLSKVRARLRATFLRIY